MSRAEIIVEDTEDSAETRFYFRGGFDSTSKSHQLAQIIQGKLDEMVASGTLGQLAEPRVDSVAAADSPILS